MGDYWPPFQDFVFGSFRDDTIVPPDRMLQAIHGLGGDDVIADSDQTIHKISGGSGNDIIQYDRDGSERWGGPGDDIFAGTSHFREFVVETGFIPLKFYLPGDIHGGSGFDTVTYGLASTDVTIREGIALNGAVGAVVVDHGLPSILPFLSGIDRLWGIEQIEFNDTTVIL